MWHVTCGTWHVTCHMWRYTWHMTCDMFGGGWTFSQNFSSLAFTVCDLWYHEDLEEKDDSLNQLMNDEAVYRTAPATPGLLKTNMWNHMDLKQLWVPLKKVKWRQNKLLINDYGLLFIGHHPTGVHKAFTTPGASPPCRTVPRDTPGNKLFQLFSYPRVVHNKPGCVVWNNRF